MLTKKAIFIGVALYVTGTAQATCLCLIWPAAGRCVLKLITAETTRQTAGQNGQASKNPLSKRVKLNMVCKILL